MERERLAFSHIASTSFIENAARKVLFFRLLMPG